MSYQPTGAYKFTRIPQFVEEATYATTPTSPVFTSCGAITDLALSIDIQSIKNRQLGSRDIYQEVKSGQLYNIVLKYQPFNSLFMKYGTEYFSSTGATGVGNIYRSLSILWSQTVNATEYFYLVKGARTEKIEISVTETKVEVTQTMVASVLNTPATTFVGAGGAGTPSYCAPNSTTVPPWSGLTGGSHPLTINGKSYDTITFKAGVTHNLDKIKPLGESVIKYLEPTNRDITVDFDIIYTDVSADGTGGPFDTISDAIALTARTASYQLNSVGPVTLNFTNLYLDKFNTPDSPTANKIKTITFSGVAQQVAVSG